MQPIVRQFYEYLKSGKIMGLKCGECGYVLLPPLGTCLKCGSYDLNWVPLSGRGELLFASVGTHRLMGLEFIQGTVKLEEGPLVPGRIIVDDFDYSRPEKIWDYNQAGISVMAEMTKNPMGVDSIAFRVIR